MTDDTFRARLGSDVPTIAVHYAQGPPFRSMMDLDGPERAAVLERGEILGPARFRDPTCVDTRTWLFERRGSHRELLGKPAAELTPMVLRDLGCSGALLAAA